MPRSRRPVVGWLFVAAGALLGARIVLTLAAGHPASGWLIFLAACALVVAFELVFLVRSPQTLFRAALQFAAVGFAVVALDVLVPLDDLIVRIGLVLAAVGMIAAGILSPITRRLRGRAGGVFVGMMVLGGVWAALLLTTASTAITVVGALFALALVVDGILLITTRGRG